MQVELRFLRQDSALCLTFLYASFNSCPCTAVASFEEGRAVHPAMLVPRSADMNHLQPYSLTPPAFHSVPQRHHFVPARCPPQVFVQLVSYFQVSAPISPPEKPPSEHPVQSCPFILSMTRSCPVSFTTLAILSNSLVYSFTSVATSPSHGNVNPTAAGTQVLFDFVFATI